MVIAVCLFGARSENASERLCFSIFSPEFSLEITSPSQAQFFSEIAPEPSDREITDATRWGDVPGDSPVMSLEVAISSVLRFIFLKGYIPPVSRFTFLQFCGLNSSSFEVYTPPVSRLTIFQPRSFLQNA